MDHESIRFKPTQLYADLPLPPALNSIRLLELAPPTDQSDHELHGTLSVANLDDRPAFTALSYVWGQSDGRTDCTVLCNNCVIEITPNCRDALLTLRRRHGTLPLTIWVDSICINQDNKDEKVSQIGLVKDIYTYARPVFLWLGPGTERTDRAIEQLHFFATQRLRPLATPWTDGHGARSPARDTILWAMNLASHILQQLFTSISEKRLKQLREEFCFNDLDALLQTDWLTRAWTFQEVVLACDPIVVRGNKAISWAVFHQGLDFVYHARPTFELHYVFKKTQITWPAFEPWKELYELWRQTPRPMQWTRPSPAIESEMQSLEQYSQSKIKLEVVVALAGSIVICLTAVLPISALVGLGLLITIPAWFGTDTSSMPPAAKFVTTVVSLIMTVDALLTFICLSLFMVGGYFNALQIWSDKRIDPLFRTSKDLLLAPIYAALAFLRRTLIHWLLRAPYGPRILRHAVSSEALQDLNRHNERSRKARASFIPKIIRSLRSRRAKRPEDKAFALHGVLGRFGMKPAAIDYKTPLGTIYHDFYRVMLDDSPELINLLLDAGVGSLEAPSWVPDWSTLADKAWLHQSFVIDYTQSRFRRQKPTFSFKDRGLCVKVSWRGSVSFVSDAFPLGRGQSDLGEDELLMTLCRPTLALHTWLRAIKEHSRILRPYEDISFVVFNALFAEKATLGNLKPQTSKEEARAFDEWYSRMLESFPNIGGDWDQQRIEDIICSFLREHASVRDFVLECCRRFDGRRVLLFSETGGIGVGPANMSIGDKIAAVDGLSAPLILREVPGQQSPGQYEIVGCAYISHLMAGLGQVNRGGNIIPVALQETGEGTGEYVLRWPDKLRVHTYFGTNYWVEGDVEENTMTEYGLIRKTVDTKSSEFQDVVLV